MEEKPIGVEEPVTTQPPVEQPETEIPAPVVEQKPKINKFVILGGILGILVFTGAVFGAYKLVTKQPQPTPWPTPSPATAITPTPTPDLTAGWNVYTSTKHGFSIRYPNTFLLPSETEKTIPFLLANSTIPAEQAAYIFVEENPQKFEFLEWLRSSEVKQEGIILEPTVELRIKEEMISGIKWLSFEESEMPLGFPPAGEIYWATLHKDKVFLVGLLNLNYQEYKQTVNLMLSTFRFLEESDEAQIREVLDEYIPEHSAVKVFELEDLKIIGDFAKVTVVPRDVVTDKAIVILEKSEEGWAVIWGPGTAIGKNDPTLEKIPDELLE